MEKHKKNNNKPQKEQGWLRMEKIDTADYDEEQKI